MGEKKKCVRLSMKVTSKYLRCHKKQKGKRRKWSSDGKRPRRGTERDGEISQRGNRETSHNEVGEG